MQARVRDAGRRWVVGLALLGGGACHADVQVSLERAFPALSFQEPVALLQGPGDDSRWFAVEKGGRVRVFANTPEAKEASVYVDISARVESRPSEAGLLGMAFHPRFPEDPRVFLSYTRRDSPLVSHISRFLPASGNARLDADSESVLLTVAQPYANHNGGNILFGPEGYLYIGLGDGGSAGDPHGHAQNTDTLLGTMLRVDVDGKAPYAIPPDNPFAQGGGRPEIYAWGLRNPWRWSFDRASGALWVADVGQNRWEEINIVEKGGNYGWNIREGAHCYRARRCPTKGLIDPVAEYGHDQGCSVTGGYVYRGERIAALQGVYLYGDYCSGLIWGLFRDAEGRFVPRRLLESGLSISSFAEGNDGELYVLDLRGGGIYRLVVAGK